MSILVIDVGTSGLRAAVVRPDATIAARAAPRAAPGHAGAGPRRVRRRRAWPTAALDVARRGAGRGRPGRRGRHRQPAGVDDRVGPRHRRAGRPGARLAGPAHDRHLPRAPGRRARRRAQRVGHQGRPPARRGRPRPRRATCASAPSTPGSPGTSPRARCTSPTPPTPASPALQRGDGSDWDDRMLDALRITGRRCRPSSTRAASSARPPRSTARRRSPRSSATSRRR